MRLCSRQCETVSEKDVDPPSLRIVVLVSGRQEGAKQRSKTPRNGRRAPKLPSAVWPLPPDRASKPSDGSPIAEASEPWREQRVERLEFVEKKPLA